MVGGGLLPEQAEAFGVISCELNAAIEKIVDGSFIKHLPK